MNDSLAGMRVLAVDDDSDALALVEANLKAHGATVECSSSAHEALQQLTSAEPFDALVCDVLMPSMDGHTFVAMLRRSPRYEALAAVACSAVSDGQARQASIAAGFDSHVSKADATEMLATEVLRIVNARRNAGTASQPTDASDARG